MPETYDADGVDAMEPAVRLWLGVLVSDEFIETEASTLLHPFKDEAEVHRELDTQIFVGLEDVEPSQDRAFVIRRSASNELTVVSDSQGERISVPSIAFESLHPHIRFRWSVTKFTTTKLTGWTSKWP